MNHISPKSSEIKWAICVPSTCDTEDIKKILTDDLDQQLKNLPITIDLQLRDEMCQVKNDEKSMDFETKVVM